MEVAESTALVLELLICVLDVESLVDVWEALLEELGAVDDELIKDEVDEALLLELERVDEELGSVEEEV